MAAPSPRTLDLAAAHFARMRSGAVSVKERRAIEAWIAEDAVHARAYEQVSRLWTDLDEVRSDPRVLGLREEARRGVGRMRRARLAAALAAVFVLGSLGAGFGLARSGLWGREAQRADVAAVRQAVYSTRVGQMATVALADGSMAILDTDSAIRFSQADGRRNVELVRGRALFKVRHDPAHPFVVSARGRTVTALGTQFDVYLKRDTLEVGLIEGRVRVEDPAAARQGRRSTTDLNAGYRLVVQPTETRLEPLAGGEGAAWLQHRLVFDDVPIAEIASELNRYSEKKIVVADAGVARSTMSAVLQSDDPATFLESVRMLHLARVHETATGYNLTAP